MARRRKKNSIPLDNPVVWIIAAVVVVIAIFSGTGNDSNKEKSSSPTINSSSSTSAPSESQSSPSASNSTDEEPSTDISKPDNSTPITFVSWPETISRGDEGTVSIKGAPNTSYRITVNYKSGPSTADGLESKTSDDNGLVSWTWRVGQKTATGIFSISVSGGGQKETVYFTITE